MKFARDPDIDLRYDDVFVQRKTAVGKIALEKLSNIFLNSTTCNGSQTCSKIVAIILIFSQSFAKYSRNPCAGRKFQAELKLCAKNKRRKDFS